MSKNPTAVTTGTVRLGYVHLFEAVAVSEGADPKFSVSVIIPKSDTETLQKVRAAIDAAKELGKGKFGNKIPASLKTPLRDGDTERPDDPAYANSFFLTASSKQRPSVVDRDLNAIMDKEQVYSGCYGRVNLNFYAFNTSGNRGIAAGLNAVQFVKDGEPLGSKVSVEDAFGGENAFDDLL